MKFKILKPMRERPIQNWPVDYVVKEVIGKSMHQVDVFAPDRSASSPPSWNGPYYDSVGNEVSFPGTKSAALPLRYSYQSADRDDKGIILVQHFLDARIFLITFDKAIFADGEAFCALNLKPLPCYEEGEKDYSLVLEVVERRHDQERVPSVIRRGIIKIKG